MDTQGHVSPVDSDHNPVQRVEEIYKYLSATQLLELTNEFKGIKKQLRTNGKIFDSRFFGGFMSGVLFAASASGLLFYLSLKK